MSNRLGPKTVLRFIADLKMGTGTRFTFLYGLGCGAVRLRRRSTHTQGCFIVLRQGFHVGGPCSSPPVYPGVAPEGNFLMEFI